LIPSGTIVVKDIFGNEIYKKNINDRNRKVLPDGNWDGAFSFHDTDVDIFPGLLKAELLVNYGQTNKQIVDSINFFYLPAKSVLVLIVILGGVVFLLYLMVLLKKMIK
jgi:hypothetical protein